MDGKKVANNNFGYRGFIKRTIEVFLKRFWEELHIWTKILLKNENETVKILKNKKGQVFLVHLSNACWTDHHSLSMLSLKPGGNPKHSQAWTEYSMPVLTANVANQSYGAGRWSFFKSPDGAEDWIVYHANPRSRQKCEKPRSPRMQEIRWKPDGSPELGKPLPVYALITKPQRK